MTNAYLTKEESVTIEQSYKTVFTKLRYFVILNKRIWSDIEK